MNDDDGSPGCSSDESSDERELDEGKVERTKKVLRMEDVNTKFENLKKLRAQGVINRGADHGNDDLEVCIGLGYSRIIVISLSLLG